MVLSPSVAQAWHVPGSFLSSLPPPLGQLAGYPQAVVAVLLPQSAVPVPQPHSITPDSPQGAAADPMAKARPEPANASTSSAPAALSSPTAQSHNPDQAGSDSSQAICQPPEQLRPPPAHSSSFAPEHHGPAPAHSSLTGSLPEGEPAAAEAAQAVWEAGLAERPSGPSAVAGLLGTLAGLCCAALSSGALLKSATQRVLGGRADAQQLQGCGGVRGPSLRCCTKLLMAAQHRLHTFHAEGGGTIKNVALLSTGLHRSKAAAAVISLFSRAAS